MLLNLPVARQHPVAEGLGAIVTRAQALLRGSRARRRLAGQLVRRDAATGLAERRPATLWLHAMAGIADRQGDQLAVALIKADAAPADVAEVLRAAAGPAGMASRWDDSGTYLLSAPGDPHRLHARLAYAAAHAGMQLEAGIAAGTAPDLLLARAAQAMAPVQAA
jgi:hypothetical protein